MSDGYRRRQTQYGSLSGSVLVNPATNNITLAACRNANWTVFVQGLRFHVATPGFAGSIWTVNDSTGAAVSGDYPTDNAPSPSTANGPRTYDIDFGPEGIALAPGASLVLFTTASDAHGTVTWDAYQKLTATVNLSSNPE